MTRKRYENRGAALAAYVVLYRPPNTAPHPNWIGSIVAEMQASARMAKRWSESICNVDMTEAETERGHARVQKRQDGLNKALCNAGLINMRVELGGDPRGTCGTLEITDAQGDIVSDGWGDGLAIY